MNPAALFLLIFAVVLLPAAITMGGFGGLSLIGVLAVLASIVLTIATAPSRKEDR